MSLVLTAADRQTRIPSAHASVGLIEATRLTPDTEPDRQFVNSGCVIVAVTEH